MNRTTALLVASALAGSGCSTVTSKVPGVLDLRSDGKDAPLNTEALRPPRSGFDGFAYGAGVTGGADVVIEDRNHYVINLIPIMNESSTEEWQMALGDQAMRNVAITEQYGAMTWLVGAVKALIPAVGGLISGTWDFRARGTRILASGSSVREESIAPPPPAVDTAVTPGVGY